MHSILKPSIARKESNRLGYIMLQKLFGHSDLVRFMSDLRFSLTSLFFRDVKSCVCMLVYIVDYFFFFVRFWWWSLALTWPSSDTVCLSYLNIHQLLVAVFLNLLLIQPWTYAECYDAILSDIKSNSPCLWYNSTMLIV